MEVLGAFYFVGLIVFIFICAQYLRYCGPQSPGQCSTNWIRAGGLQGGSCRWTCLVCGVLARIITLTLMDIPCAAAFGYMAAVSPWRFWWALWDVRRVLFGHSCFAARFRVFFNMGFVAYSPEVNEWLVFLFYLALPMLLLYRCIYCTCRRSGQRSTPEESKLKGRIVMAGLFDTLTLYAAPVVHIFIMVYNLTRLTQIIAGINDPSKYPAFLGNASVALVPMSMKTVIDYCCKLHSCLILIAALSFILAPWRLAQVIFDVGLLIKNPTHFCIRFKVLSTYAAEEWLAWPLLPLLVCVSCGQAIPRLVAKPGGPSTLDSRGLQLQVCDPLLFSSYECLMKIPTGNQKIFALHGTSRNTALNIMANGFTPSENGMLGPGVYISRDINKTKVYADMHSHDGGAANVVVEVDMDGASLVAVHAQGECLQYTWQQDHDIAWVPAGCGMVHSGLEEACVKQASRINPVEILTYAADPQMHEVRFHPIVLSPLLHAIVDELGLVAILNSVVWRFSNISAGRSDVTIPFKFTQVAATRCCFCIPLKIGVTIMAAIYCAGASINIVRAFRSSEFEFRTLEGVLVPFFTYAVILNALELFFGVFLLFSCCCSSSEDSVALRNIRSPRCSREDIFVCAFCPLVVLWFLDLWYFTFAFIKDFEDFKRRDRFAVCIALAVIGRVFRIYFVFVLKSIGTDIGERRKRNSLPEAEQEMPSQQRNSILEAEQNLAYWDDAQIIKWLKATKEETEKEVIDSRWTAAEPHIPRTDRSTIQKIVEDLGKRNRGVMKICRKRCVASEMARNTLDDP